MKLYVTILFFLWSFVASACLRIEGNFIVNNDQIKLNQKIDFGKTYSFNKDEFILHIKFNSSDHKKIQIEANLDQRLPQEIKKSETKTFSIERDIEKEFIIFNQENKSIKLKLKLKAYTI